MILFVFPRLFEREYSLPSEKVPAPPSPKHKFDSSLSSLFLLILATSTLRSLTFLPRSTIIGQNPNSIRRRAAKSPAGPAPMIITSFLLLTFR